MIDRHPRLAVLITLFAVAIVVAACGSSSGPSGAPSPTTGGGPVTTEAQAIARVMAHEPRLTGITKRDPDAIGQASWYEVQPASGVGAFVVSVRVGWGDCPAGCIDEHTWVYAIGPDGSVTLQSEGGPDVPADAWPSPATVGTATGILVSAVAGPTCPVETVPPDPACAPRAVVATIIVRDAQGADVAKAVTDPAGTVFVALDPGEYVIVGTPVEGLMGTPDEQSATVADGATTAVTLAYDTGIR
jgi:hypothetical protein